MDTSPRVSVIVRTKNSDRTVLNTFNSIRAQSVACEIVVVDSGSTDRTLPIAQRFTDIIQHVDATTFSFGGSLNVGCSVAAGEIVVALSSHCAFQDPAFLARTVAHFDDDAVVATCGATTLADGSALDGAFHADHAFLRTRPMWGFSNHASAWRRATWQKHAFREDLPANEDKEWSWRATSDGGVIVLDRSLDIPGGHRRAAGLRAYRRRLVAEFVANQMIIDMPRPGLRDVIADVGRRDPQLAYLRGSRPWGRTRLVEVAAHLESRRVGARR